MGAPNTPGLEPIAIVTCFELPPAAASRLDEIETVQRISSAVTTDAGIDRKRIGFTCSGSNDMLVGRPFSWLMAMDGIGAWPPIEESHVEMDGAWALYEAWVRLQHGDIDAALVYTFGSGTSAERPMSVFATQLDPYYLAPSGIDYAEVSALQARAMLDAGVATEADFAAAAVAAGLAPTAGAALASPVTHAPLRSVDLPRMVDGAAALVLARGDFARSVCRRPAWISGISHITDAHHIGMRDLAASPSLRRAAEQAGVGAGETDRVETMAMFGPHEVLIRRELAAAGLRGRGGAEPRVNAGGSVRAAFAPMSAGLMNLVRAASAIHSGSADRAVAHAASGPAMQHNLVAVLEADR